MANFNLTHTGQQVDDAITQVRNGTFARTYDSVAALLTYLQGLVTLPAVGTTFTVHGRDAKGDTPTRIFEVKQGTHTDDGGMIRTISGTDHISMLDWDGDIRDYGAKAVTLTDQTAFDSTSAIAAALGTGRDILIPDINRAGTNSGYYFKMEGQVVISAANGMKNGQRIRGEGGKSSILVQPDDGVAYPGAFDVRLFDIVFDGIDFRGAQNNAWYDPSGTTIPTGKEVDITTSYNGGAVIRGTGYDRCKILNCTFRYFNFSNATNTDASIIGFKTTTGITISNCVFKDNYNCVDISLKDQTGRSIVTDNICVDDSRTFCHLSTLNSDVTLGSTNDTSTTSHHIITGNQVHRGVATANGKTGGLYGLVVHYQGGISHSTISNNIFDGGTRWGIYLRGNDSSNQGIENAPNQTGPDIISNNIISNYGGRIDMGVGSTNELYQGGIQLDNTQGVIIEGNIFEKIGYDADGTVGDYFASGMSLLRSGNDINISNNIIRGVYGSGIAVCPTVSEDDTNGDGFNLENLRILGNTISTCYKHALNISNRSTSDSLRSIFVKDNYFEYEGAGDATINGYALVNILIEKNEGTSGSAGKEVYYEFSSNTLHGNGSCKGLLISKPEESNALISGNEFIDVTHGIKSHFANFLSGDGSSTDYVEHRDIGTKYQIKENHFRNCDRGVDFDTTGNHVASFIHPSNTFLTDDGGSNITGVAQNVARNGPGESFNIVVFGELAGFDASGNRLLKIYSSAPPIGSAYLVGDVVINNEPAVGEPYAWVCTTAGSPGTWSPTATL
jgi:hypothetical protein